MTISFICQAVSDYLPSYVMYYTYVLFAGAPRNKFRLSHNTAIWGSGN